jgi:glutamine---fructose-6-phosphate transaminase (isomerizing)
MANALARRFTMYLAGAVWARIASIRHLSFHWRRRPSDAGGPAVVFLPCSSTTLNCGLAGLIAVYGAKPPAEILDLKDLNELSDRMLRRPLSVCASDTATFDARYMDGDETVDRVFQLTRDLKRQHHFIALYVQTERQRQLTALHAKLAEFMHQEVAELQAQMGHLETELVEKADRRIVKLKDIVWCIHTEVIGNIAKIKDLMVSQGATPSIEAAKIYLNLNTVLNSIDRLEVRGRDSAGISLLFILDKNAYADFRKRLAQDELTDQFDKRSASPILGNKSISVQPIPQSSEVGLTLTYKVAAEIGSLGDNVTRLRKEIAQDPVLGDLARCPHRFHTVSAHTRWASVGAITIANCHPVDNGTSASSDHRRGIIHACLNGDIDNYISLKKEWEESGELISEEITTDTKIIPLQIEKHLRQGHRVEEAFRLAVNDFEGSHAIAMHTNLAPGKFFLAQRGSGQAVFVGLAKDHYLPTSEVYGFVEETAAFVKLDGEKIIDGNNGPTQGQIFILDQNSTGGLDGITARCYDDTPIQLTDADIQQTEITSRDIDRQDFPHYFLKEISEAPDSVARTLQNRWKIDPSTGHYSIVLGDAAFPQKIVRAVTDQQLRRVYFIGQGTAGIAAQACADILNHYLNEPALKISALKASELSGFQLDDQADGNGMRDALVVAISQSGTTTDTNRAVDMAKARGAHTMAIVNRRDSDITFKVDGVVYTSSGRDIEMSVASTKAFYSQIVAGALVGLKIAEIKGRRSPAFVADEIKALLQLPDQMRSVLKLSDAIKTSAERLAPTRTYWATVGSGPNKASADEIRIKLSELCYKTISSDYVEDKKHIDLSSEPLIIICAAGTPSTVIGDIIKDTAIFKAHKATPVAIVDEGEDRFDPYAEDVFHVPAVSSHLAPILNTLAGHLWGYYAALAINKGSLLLHAFREEIQQNVDQFARDGLDVYEVVLEKSFREKIAEFYARFRQRQIEAKLPTVISHDADLLLLLKYLSGRLPVTDFELDFGQKGTALNMLNSMFRILGESINGMSRPVDAIKHQAKTVTVGTSRISEKIGGILFEALIAHEIQNAQLTNRNIIVLKNLQAVVGEIKGSILYRIDRLNVLGEPTSDTTIEILRKEGVLKPLTSRVETDKALKGTKRIIVHQGNVYIGKGRKDDRSIIVIPAISTEPSASNRIEYLLLLNIGFKEQIDLAAKTKALGGKYEHIKNIVQENSFQWEDDHLNLVPIDDLFGRSAEKIGEGIVAQLQQGIRVP